jgi:hypothetical protein
MYAHMSKWINNKNVGSKKRDTAILISNKTNFKISQKKKVCPFILIKRTNHLEVIKTINIYALSIHTLNFIKQIQLNIKKHINHNTKL